MTPTQTPASNTALVTGASGGIGEAIARELAVAGTHLVLVARGADKLRALADELTAAHSVTVDVVAADLAAAGAGAALAAQLGDRQIDILVNNAGFGDFGPFAEADPAKISQMMALNMVTLTDLTRALLPGMIQRRKGMVMNVASTAAFMPGPLMAVYYATKAYVLSLSEALADELRDTGVSVTAVCPGPVASGFQAGADMQHSKLVRGKTIMSAQTCARLAVRGMYKHRAVVVVGAKNKLLVLSPRFLPRSVVPGMVRRAQAPH